jgi:cytochrome c551/c552
MKSKFILAVTILFSLNVFAGPPSEEGRVIFTARCAGCHNVNKILTGPALAGVDQRRTIDWIINFVHSSQTVVKSGDEYAVTLFNKFNRIPMPDHPDLTADNIKSIVEYIKTESKTTADKAPFERQEKSHPNYTPLSISNYWVFGSYFAIVALLVAVLLMAVKVMDLRRNENSE